MTNKIPCEVVQDLFPSYIDGLTSDVTNTVIKGHIAECGRCKTALDAMKEPQAEPVNLEDKQEIDFLKKTRKRIKRIVTGSIFIVLFTVAAVLIARMFFLGSRIYGDAVACEVQVDGNHLVLSGVAADDRLGISSVAYEEKNGVVTVSFKAVRKSPFHRGEFRSNYTAAGKITQVCIDNRVIWARGERVLAVTSAVFNTRHAYIGDMPENGRTARALNIENYLGGFTSELQTERKPYGWKMILEKDVPVRQQKNKEQRMKAYACILLAAIENLGEVSFSYTVDGDNRSLTVTQKDATAFAQQDIKECGKDILSLQALLKKAGLDSDAYVNMDNVQYNQETIHLNIVNNADGAVAGYNISYSVDGKLYGTQGGENADGILIRKGETMSVSLASKDFRGEQLDGSKELLIEVSVYDKAGKTYDAESPVRMPATAGAVYNYTLTGNEKDGYKISQ